LVATRSSLSLLFLVFPLLIWSAVRFQLAGSAPCVLLVSVLAISAATDEVGPFADHTLFEVMVNLQALNGSAALTALLLSALVTEQNNIRTEIERVCGELAEVVERLAPGRPGE
ncbi:MASE1 domain-containing protein, partial [Streptomyces sp. SID13726]|uniref:MASE1 domain-containing protein n=2 Tax=Streptomyces TaxID=1883 RepID=UPI0013B664CE